MAAKRDGAAVGIDVGTTYSCVGVYRSNWVEIIENDVGKKKTPSCIAFTDTKRLIGEAAMSHLIMHPSNAIFDSKRLIGRRFTDAYVQSDMNKWPFKVMKDPDANRPMIVVPRKGEMKQFAPQEILSMLLTKMCETAEAHIGCPVNNAVISVPASFNPSQRQAIKDAAAIIGLNVLQIISEPTAAAIAYAFNNNVGNGEKKNVLVFELGGGSLDVSLIAIENGTFEVISTAGDTHLGGEDFSNRIVDHLVQEFKSNHGKDISSNHKALGRLRASCEKAKHELSSSTTPATIDIDRICDDIDFTSTISRNMFESLNIDLFHRCIQIVEDCWSKANIVKDSIHEILLIGGSTRVPLVQELLRQFFPGKQLCKVVNADEAVAIGATLLAASLNKMANTMEVPNLNIADVIPRSLFLSSNYGHHLTITSKNTAVPIKRILTIPFKTSCDYQQTILFHVFEENEGWPRDYNLVHEFTVPCSSLAFDGPFTINICFDINIDGVLNISVDGKMTFTAGQLREEEMEKMVQNAKKHKLDDEEYRKNVNAKNSLERYAYKAMNEMWNGQRNSHHVDTDMKEVKEAIEEVIQWLRNAEHAEANEIENKKKKLQGLCDPIIDKMHQPTTTRGVRGAHPHQPDDPSLAPHSSSYGTETDPPLVNRNLFLDNGFGHSSQQLFQPGFNVQPGQTKTSTKSGSNGNQGSSLGDLSESKTGLDDPIIKQKGSLDGIVKDQAEVNHEKENQRAGLDQRQVFDQKTPGLTKFMPSGSATVDTQNSTHEASSLQLKRDGLMKHTKVHQTEGRPTRHMAATEKAPTSKEEERSPCEASESKQRSKWLKVNQYITKGKLFFPNKQGDSTEIIMTSAAMQPSNQSFSDSIKED